MALPQRAPRETTMSKVFRRFVLRMELFTVIVTCTGLLKSRIDRPDGVSGVLAK